MRFPLEVMKTKVIGILEFKAVSPINVGVGSEGVVRESIMIPEGLVIPSSTWKGAFRNISEQIAKQMEFGGIARLAVELYSEGGTKYRRDGGKFERYLKEFFEVLQGSKSDLIPDNKDQIESLLGELGYSAEEIRKVKRDEVDREALAAMAEEYLALHCPIGKLYGNKVTAGKVRFFDSIVNANPEIRAGTGIDRKSGKVQEKHLYFIKVIPKRDIRLTMIADNLLQGEEDAKLFAYTLKMIKTLGISIGSRKSSGLGFLEIKNGKFYVLDLEEDGKTMDLKIGNVFKKISPIDLEEFLKWLCP